MSSCFDYGFNTLASFMVLFDSGAHLVILYFSQFLFISALFSSESCSVKKECCQLKPRL